MSHMNKGNQAMTNASSGEWDNTYTILISEEQRAIIERALINLAGAKIHKCKAGDDETVDLMHLFASLPDEETEPGEINSFIS